VRRCAEREGGRGGKGNMCRVMFGKLFLSGQENVHKGCEFG
jgi:hypothetical protein